MKNPGMATHSEASFNEAEEIRILSGFLERKKTIKTFFGQNEKTPNHDGFFELLNNTVKDINKPPKKQFIVQIKKTENVHKVTQGKNKGKYRYKDLDTKFLYYVKEKIAESPAIYFVVDIATNDIFGIYLSDEKLMQMDFEDKAEIDYWFSEEEKFANIDAVTTMLNKIADDRNRAFINKTPEEIAEIQDAVEYLNNLFNNDLSFIKEQMFPNLWRFGIANSITNEMHMSVTSYQGEGTVEIPTSTTNLFALYPQIKGKADYGFKEFDNMSNYFNHFDLTGTLTPMKYVKDTISKILENYFNNHECLKLMPNTALAEIVFSFMDKFDAVLENDISNDIEEKNIDDIYKAFFICMNYISYLLSDSDLSETESQVSAIIKRNISNGYVYHNRLDILNKIQFSMCNKQFAQFYNDNKKTGFNANLFGIIDFDYIICFLAIDELKKRNIKHIKRVWNYNYWEIMKNDHMTRAEEHYEICEKWFYILNVEYLKMYKTLFKDKTYFSCGKFEYAFCDVNENFNKLSDCIRKYKNENFIIEKSVKSFSELSKWDDDINTLYISNGFIISSFIKNKKMIYDSLRCLLYQGICKALDIKPDGITFNNVNKIFE